MGLLGGLSRRAVGTAKAVGSGAMGISKVAGKTAGYGGHRIISTAFNNPLKTAAFVGGVAATGYALADQDGRGDGMQVAGKAALGAVTASAIPGVTMAGAYGATGLAGGAAGVGGAAMMIGRNALKVPETAVSFSDMKDIKFSALGKGMLVGAAGVEGMSKAVKRYEQIRMGTNDGMLRKATPIIPQAERNPSYANNGGATGDLVFSMYNNR